MTKEIEFNITGMDCADCALALEKGVGQLDDVEACEINFATAKMRVSAKGEELDENQIRRKIKNMGYGVTEAGQRPEIVSGWKLAADLVRRPRNTLTLLAILFVGLAFLAGWLQLPNALEVGLFTLGGLLGLYFPARSGWVALRSGQGLDMNVLMTLAAVGAFIIGEYGEAATVIVLFSLGEALEGFTMERARDSIRQLMLLAPAEATLLQGCVDCDPHKGQPLPDDSGVYESGLCPWCGQHEQVVPVEALDIGDLILVKPGERIPMDGVVRAGHSAVNQAPITGESVPVEKEAGDEVFAGTINGEGALEIEITRLAEDNTLSRLIHLVEEAQAQKTPAQRFVDRFARVYTPAVVVGAVLIAAVPPLFFGQPFLDPATGHGWLYRSLTMLVIACPCALVIATPVTVVSAISTLARRGVLVKGGLHLEKLGRIEVMAFDKTGTLTHGRPQVTEMLCTDEACRQQADEDCDPCDQMLALAAAVERRSNHPLAGAIVRAAEERGVPDLEAKNVTSLPGRGIHGNVEGKQAVVGSHDLFHQGAAEINLEAYCPSPQQEANFCDRIQELEASGQTVMLVGWDGNLLGLLAVSDPPRESSQSALEQIHRAGIRHTVMLTGDNASVAHVVAQSIGIDDVRAGLMPAQKLEAVQALQREFGQIAMVGDGVNDAPALAAADLGIAMGGAGTDQAIETADVALMADDLAQLPFAIRLGRKAVNTIQFNIWFALLIKAVFLVTAFFGIATLWMAVFADMGASLIVTINGMRLLRKGKQARS
jgi:Cd2+/Zn2+-exporting ATPase